MIRLVRILFFNEGNLHSHVLGHGRLDEALRAGLNGTRDVEARWQTQMVTHTISATGIGTGTAAGASGVGSVGEARKPREAPLRISSR